MSSSITTPDKQLCLYDFANYAESAHRPARPCIGIQQVDYRLATMAIEINHVAVLSEAICTDVTPSFIQPQPETDRCCEGPPVFHPDRA